MGKFKIVRKKYNRSQTFSNMTSSMAVSFYQETFGSFDISAATESKSRPT